MAGNKILHNDFFEVKGVIAHGELRIGTHEVHGGYTGLWNTEASITTTSQYLIISAGTDTYINGDSVYIRAGNNSTSNELRVQTTGVSIGGNTVWHAGNDGASSGLDADSVDGYHASRLLRIDGAAQAGPNFTSLIPSSNESYFKEVQQIETGVDFPSGAYTYGYVQSTKMSSMKFQWYVPHTGSRGDHNTQDTIYFRTGWGATQMYGWKYLIHSGNIAGQTVAAAGTATTATSAGKLSTARNIALTGAVTGNANFDGSGNISIATTATSDPTLTLSGDASGSATFTNLGNATLSVAVNNNSHTHQAENVTGGILGQSGRIALANHPEGGAMLTPSFENDLAFIVERGGNVSVYLTDSTDYTALSLNNTGAAGFSNTIPFNGSTNYTYATLPTAASVVVYDIEMPFGLSYGNTWYVDFGAGAWQAKDVTFLAFNTDTNNSEQYYKVVGGTFSGVNSGLKFTSGSYNYIRTSDGGTSWSYNRLRVVMGNWDRTGVRIAAIGAKYYNSGSLTATLMSRGGGTMWGNLAVTGTVTGSNLNVSNWDTAYGWGNHASAGYQAASTAITTSNIGSQSVSSATTATTAGAAGSAPLLSALGDYVWNANTDGRSFARGIQTSFVQATDGYPSYGSVVRIATYTGNNDGSTTELYFPYSSQYGGTSMRYRLGQYDNAGFTGWKTVVDSDNIGSYALTSLPSHTHTVSEITDFPTIPTNNNQLTNGAGYITGYTVTAQDVSSAGAMIKSGEETSSAMKKFYTTFSNNEDWQNSAISILERDLVGATQSADQYSPNLNFHWASRVSNSLWMNSSGQLNWGDYSGSGIPAADGTFKTGTLYAGTESITATKVGNWNTAYSWGNHASGGYLTSSSTDLDSRYYTETEVDTLLGTKAASSHTHGIGNITDAARWWNNFGDNHTTRTGFDAQNAPLTTGFGWRFVQGNTNSPGTNNNSQYYSLIVGLGNDYNYDLYGMQMAIPRNTTSPYISIRYEENRVLGAWQKISAGYADSAGAVAWASVSGKPSTFSPSAHTHTPTEVGLSNLSSNGNALAGNFTATGDITAYSDARVKENISTIDNALEKVMSLRGVEYNKIGSEEKSVGVIAQEIQEVLPEVVKEQEDGMLSVAYGNLTAVLIEALKDQQKQIDKLKAKLDGITK